MLIDQYHLGLLGHFFPATKREIDAFHQAFCPTRLPTIPSEVHSFQQRATPQNVLTTFQELNLHRQDIAPPANDVHVLIEHVILVIDRLQDVVATIPVHDATRLRPIDCFRGVRQPDQVQYLCSVRRRRLTTIAPLFAFTLSELSIGILYRPTDGFQRLVRP